MPGRRIRYLVEQGLLAGRPCSDDGLFVRPEGSTDVPELARAAKRDRHRPPGAVYTIS